MKEIIDYPKLHSPFVKENHKVIDKLEEGFEWLYEPGVCAVDKLHGTNLCVTIEGGHIETIDNRTTRVCKSCFIPIKGNANKFLIGVLNACNRGWLTEDGTHYGELIGPDINGNIHGTSDYLFVPFSHLHRKYHWHSWVQNKYPKNFQSISDWFKELPSLFSKNVFGKEVLAEGLVFYHPNGRKCKLRRDMFDWYDGDNHKSNKKEKYESVQI
jgi:hypothetical protein